MPKPTEPTATDPQEPTTGPQGEAKPKGGPDWQRAAEDYRAQRDAAREQAEEMRKQLDGLKGSMEKLKTSDDVKQAVDEALAKATADFDAAKASWADREKALTVAAELTGAGCIDTTALMGHMDMSKVTGYKHQYLIDIPRSLGYRSVSFLFYW